MHRPTIQPSLKPRSMHPHRLGLGLQLQSFAPAVHPFCLSAFSATTADALLALRFPSRNPLTRTGLSPSPLVLGHRRHRKRSSSMPHFRVLSTDAWDSSKTVRPPWGFPPRLIPDLVRPTTPPKRRCWHRTVSCDAVLLPSAFSQPEPNDQLPGRLNQFRCEPLRSPSTP